MQQYICFPLVALLLAGCVKDKPQKAEQPPVQLSGARKVYVTNEGNFGSGNGSVSLYDPANGQVVEDLYQSRNGAPAGDVVQSLSQVNGSYYLVVNNSKKILVCDAGFKKTGQISGLSSPRYLLPVTNQKAYVSDLYANAISIVDLNTLGKTGSIACGGWTEQMVMIYNKVFVANMKRDYLYIVNTLADKVEDSVQVGPWVGSLALDRQDRLWVLSPGDKTRNIKGRLTRINPINHQAELVLDLDTYGSASSLCLNRGKDTLYYLNEGVCRMSVSAGALPAAPFVAKGSRVFYGLGVSPHDFRIYAADAIDYNQRSNVYVFDSQGNEKAVFKAGVSANGFYFE